MKMTCPGSLIECESINISSSELMLMILYGTKTNSDIVQTTNECKMLAQLGMFNAEKKQNIRSNKLGTTNPDVPWLNYTYVETE